MAMGPGQDGNASVAPPDDFAATHNRHTPLLGCSVHSDPIIRGWGQQSGVGGGAAAAAAAAALPGRRTMMVKSFLGL